MEIDAYSLLNNTYYSYHIFDFLPSLKAKGIPTKDGQARPRVCSLLH